MFLSGSEMPFNQLPIGQLYCHISDARMRLPLTAANVYRKTSATKYKPINGAFTGKHRFPSVNVCIVTRLD